MLIIGNPRNKQNKTNFEYVHVFLTSEICMSFMIFSEVFWFWLPQTASFVEIINHKVKQKHTATARRAKNQITRKGDQPNLVNLTLLL